MSDSSSTVTCLVLAICTSPFWIIGLATLGSELEHRRNIRRYGPQVAILMRRWGGSGSDSKPKPASKADEDLARMLAADLSDGTFDGRWRP